MKKIIPLLLAMASCMTIDYTGSSPIPKGASKVIITSRVSRDSLTSICSKLFESKFIGHQIGNKSLTTEYFVIGQTIFTQKIFINFAETSTWSMASIQSNYSGSNGTMLSEYTYGSAKYNFTYLANLIHELPNVSVSYK